ncbi:MAG: DUF4430 domain-containing protein [Nanoarchaeota archaeon]|nr:DUF4430 domain-containing protein [Nanoarchaeota archaeon]
MKKIFVLISLISIILILSLIGLRNSEEKPAYEGKTTLIIKTIGETSREIIDIKGRTALEILKQNHSVKTIQGLTAGMIKCIDDICSKNSYWWKFSVNGDLSIKSADKYYPKDEDIIFLEYGESR